MDFGVSRDVYLNIAILFLLSIAKFLFKRLSLTVCGWQKLLKSNQALSLSPDPFFLHSLINIHLDLLLTVLFEMRFASLFIFLMLTVAGPERLEQIEVAFSNKRQCLLLRHGWGNLRRRRHSSHDCRLMIFIVWLEGDLPEVVSQCRLHQ